MIVYFCPDKNLKSGGIRRIYRHVQILVGQGMPAAVMHGTKDFVVDDMPSVPVRYADQPGALSPGDIVVVPEGLPGVMEFLKDLPVRRVVFALSWSYIYSSLREGIDWRGFGVERVIAESPMIADYVSWAMSLPVTLLDFPLDSSLYHFVPAAEKKLCVCYFDRKALCMKELASLLRSRNPRFISELEWVRLGAMSEKDYAAALRSSAVYLALGTAEGLNLSVYEAWRCGTIVAGFNGIGLKDVMVGEGAERNCVLAENGDYFTLAKRLEPLLLDLLAGRLDSWTQLVRNGRRLATPHTPEAEERSVLEFWRGVV